jgi:EAL and modified HD-GYP domain-containing signal transduction protein
MAGKRIPINRISALRMISTLNDPQIKIREVEESVIRDVRLSYKLLRYANSALCGISRPVESIRHAIVLVGLEKIRIWASLLLLYGLEDKSREVVVTGAIRARMCEQLAKAQGSEEMMQWKSESKTDHDRPLARNKSCNAFRNAPQG